MEVVIEIVEPGRRAPNIRRFSGEKIIVGRAWDADLVIADDEVDPQHIAIHLDIESDQFSLEDLDSTYGVRVNGRRLNPEQTIPYGELITLGQTSFRVHRRTDTVPPVSARTTTERLLRLLSQPWLAILLGIAAVTLQQYISFLSTAVQLEWENTLNSMLSFATGLAIWSLLWGGIAKLLKHQIRIWTHLGLSALFWIFHLLLGELRFFLLFNTLSSTVADISQAVIVATLLFTWVFLALKVTSHAHHRTRAIIAGGIVSLFITSSFIIPRFQQQEYVNLVPLEIKSMHPGLLLRGGDSNSEFMNNLNQSFERTTIVAKERREERREKKTSQP